MLVAISVLAGLRALTTASAEGVPVLVATRTIAGGSPVTESDVAVVNVAPDLVPDGAAGEPGAVVGRTVVVDVPARAVLSRAVLLDGAPQARAGMVALPVRFSEAAAVALLRVGEVVDVLGPAAGGSGYEVVAAGVRVLAIPRGGSGGLLDDGEPPLVVLEVIAEQAPVIAASGSVSGLGFAIR